MKRQQFTFYRSYFEKALRLKRKADIARLIDAICAYALFHQEPADDMPIHIRKLFEELRREIDTEIRQSTDGRQCAEYKAWRKAVYERDDYTCQTCGKRGVKLNAHHKKAYAFYPDLRYDVSNGITLCCSCHKLLHRKGWKSGD